MHRRAFSAIRRLRLPVSQRRLLVVRRLLTMVLGAVGVLALSGSQVVSPAVAAFVQPDENAGQALPTLTAPTFPDWGVGVGVPTPYPTSSLPLPSGSSASNPYGLASTAGLTSSGIPEAAQRAYVAAAAELARTDPSCGLSWTLVAGIGRVESNHGRYGGSTIGPTGLVTPPILGIRLDGTRAGTARISDSDNGRYDGDTAFDRAVGPMQFLPGTWATYGNGANPQDMNAAAKATARYLCAGSGSLATQKGRWAAVYRYNHSDSYVSLVLSLADSYARGGSTTTFPTRPVGTPIPSPSEPPATAPGPPPAVPAPPVVKPPKQPTTKPTGRPTPGPTKKPTPRPTVTTTRPVPGQPVPPTTTPRPVPTTTTPRPAPTTTKPTPPPTTSPTPSPTPSDEASCEAQVPEGDEAAEPTPTPTPTATAKPDPDCPDVAVTPTPTATPKP